MRFRTLIEGSSLFQLFIEWGKTEFWKSSVPHSNALKQTALWCDLCNGGVKS